MAWRLGVVPYLNAEPLAAAIRERDAALLIGDAATMEALVPSQLLGTLLDGKLDAALVSVGGILPYPELCFLPDMCVSSDGPVRSILLFLRRPVEEVRTVALDASSRSAVALTRVLFAERWRTQPEFVTLPPDLPHMLEQADAALLIGNPALVAAAAQDAGRWPGLVDHRLDIGREWKELTGLPFVYAVWAAPVGLAANGQPRDLDRLTGVLRRAKEWGLRRRGLLASRGAEELGLSRQACLEYITEAIRYDLGPAQLAGMRRFCELGVRHGIFPEGAEVRPFVER